MVSHSGARAEGSYGRDSASSQTRLITLARLDESAHDPDQCRRGVRALRPRLYRQPLVAIGMFRTTYATRGWAGANRIEDAGAPTAVRGSRTRPLQVTARRRGAPVGQPARGGARASRRRGWGSALGARREPPTRATTPPDLDQ